MNKRIQMSAIAIAMVAASGSAFAADQGAFFINGNLGQSHFHSRYYTDNTGTSSAARVGYAWNLGSGAGGLGVEAGYVNLGRASVSAYDGAYSASAKLSGPVVGANYKYTFNNKMFVSVRAGWFRSKFDTKVSGIGSQSFSGNGAYSGVGVGYDITPHFSLGVNFDEYHGRATVYGTKAKQAVSSLSGFAEYRF